MTSAPDIEDLRLGKLAELSARIRSNMDAFQPIAERAKLRFAVPIALVSVIDARRQVYLGNCGIGVESMPRDQTFCTYTIMSPSVVVVEDTLQDERFRDHPLVAHAPHLRFYAGAPIVFPDHLRIGTVCLADTRPRTFARGDRMVLEHLADMVVQTLLKLPVEDDVHAVAPTGLEGVVDPAGLDPRVESEPVDALPEPSTATAPVTSAVRARMGLRDLKRLKTS